MLRRVLIQTLVWFAIQAVILLSAAGDWTWPQGWTYLGEVTVLSLATTIGLMVGDPELLKARMSSPFKRGQRPVDLAIISVFAGIYVAWFVLIGLDHRFLWTGTPLMLGSLWGLAATPVLFVLLALRTVGEEQVLKQDLAGYADYMTRTPWRIVPGVW